MLFPIRKHPAHEATNRSSVLCSGPSDNRAKYLHATNAIGTPAVGACLQKQLANDDSRLWTSRNATAVPKREKPPCGGFPSQESRSVERDLLAVLVRIQGNGRILQFTIGL